MGILITLPKKGDLADCSNWRSTALLSVLGKVFAGIFVERMRDADDQLLHNQQAGFKPCRSCIEFCKAFDSVHRPALLKILDQYGIPRKIVFIIQKLYEDSSSAVRIDGYISQWFPVLTGVRQG